jgi:hypothetical protein
VVVVVDPPTTVDVVDVGGVVVVVVVAPGNVVDVSEVSCVNGTVDVGEPVWMTFAAATAATPPTRSTAMPTPRNLRVDHDD